MSARTQGPLGPGQDEGATIPARTQGPLDRVERGETAGSRPGRRGHWIPARTQGPLDPGQDAGVSGPWPGVRAFGTWSEACSDHWLLGSHPRRRAVRGQQPTVTVGCWPPTKSIRGLLVSSQRPPLGVGPSASLRHSARQDAHVGSVLLACVDVVLTKKSVRLVPFGPGVSSGGEPIRRLLCPPRLLQPTVVSS